MRALWIILSLLTAFIPQVAQAKQLFVKSVSAGYEIRTVKVAHVRGVIDGVLAQKFLNEMIKTSETPGDRIILINSPGGNVRAGQTILRALEVEKRYGVRIVCIAEKDASSMAFDILTACDVRLAVAGAKMLVHKIESGFDSKERLTAVTLRRLADELDAEEGPFSDANAKAMGLSRRDYDAFAMEETEWTAETLHRMHYMKGFAVTENAP